MNLQYKQFVQYDGLIVLCGRYEGVDERLIQKYVDQEWSIGDYVLSGGELPAMVLLDSIIRRLPGAMSDEQSHVQDSFVDGLSIAHNIPSQIILKVWMCLKY